MLRLRKPKPPADIPSPTPTTPAELVQQFISQRDPRALAAASTAVALSFGSPFYGTGDASSDGAIVRGRDTGWQTAYDAARMALEITKESCDMFLPLKAVVGALSVLIKNYDQTSDNAEKVKEIERRVQSLSGVLASPASDDDYVEKGRRAELQRKLEGVVTRLEPLSDQHALLQFLRNVDNAKTLTGFIQELADAITDYQVSVQQGVYERTRDIHGDAKNIHGDTKNICDDTRNILEVEILAKLEPVRGAGYQAGHHDKCLPGTRETVLQNIMLWAKNPRDQNVFWLNGLAGTGKSTIAQSFSDAVAGDGFLGASFFCSRDYLDRRELKNIFPTLAYQLAYRYPHFRSHIVKIMKEDPTLAHTSLVSQLENLLVKPLSGKDISCVLVIDALDECIDNQPASAILSVLGRFAKQLPLVKFFITGRPEPRIRTGFRLPLLEPLTQIFLLHEVKPSSVDDDIRLYLTQRLTKIAKQRSNLELPNPWPHDNEIKALTKKSSGLFIFASTLARFIESEHHEPNERLQFVLSEADSAMDEGWAAIDSLYSQVLLHAFSDVHELAVFHNLRRVLGAIVLAFNPLSRKALSTILGLSTTLISTTLRHLHSIILVPADETKEIRIFHKSFPDFLQNRRRCTDPRFYIDSKIRHGGMVLSCLELVKKLKRNTCLLPPFTMNQDIPDLPRLLKDKLGGAAQYACGYWARHLKLSPTSGDYVCRVAISMTKMLESAPLWIEVMSLENRLEEVIHSVYSLLAWLDEVDSVATHELANATRDNPGALGYVTADIDVQGLQATKAKVEALTTTLRNLAMDCLRLSMHFFYPIQQCAQQVYHTALPLSPTSSQLRKHHLQNVIDAQLSHVTSFSGAPDTWGLLLRTVDFRPRQLTHITTSAQKIITACQDIVSVYDAVTFVLRQSLRAPEAVTKIQGSPDGSTLFFSHSYSVTTWDMQTGGLTHTFTTQSRISDIAVSAMGDYIACGLSNGSVTFLNTHTKEESKSFGNGQPAVTMYWLSPRELAVATRRTVYIHNIATGETLNNFSVRGHVWGMVCLGDGGGLLVGISQPGLGADQKLCFLRIVRPAAPRPQAPEPFASIEGRYLGKPELSAIPKGLGFVSGSQEPELHFTQPLIHHGELSSPTLVGEKIACITPPRGVRSFNTESCDLTTNPPPLDAATSVAVSLHRNIVAQTRDSIQIFSLDVLKSGEARDDLRPSHVYPLGEKHIVCLLQPNRHLTILNLGTLQELRPGGITSPLHSLFKKQPPSARASFSRGFVAEFGVSVVIQAWRSSTPLPEWTETANEDAPLSGLSPECTRVATFYSSPRQEVRVKDATDGTILASLLLGDDDLGAGKVYDVTFDSETRFHLKIDGPGRHVQISHDVTASPSGSHSHTITKGEPEYLSEPRTMPPYTLDANCEWVVDAKSRKICWISPGDVRRGDGGHFWAGLELVMVGDDGVVRKLSFKEPNC